MPHPHLYTFALVLHVRFVAAHCIASNTAQAIIDIVMQASDKRSRLDYVQDPGT